MIGIIELVDRVLSDTCCSASAPIKYCSCKRCQAAMDIDWDFEALEPRQLQ
jgi:hypothetical protein